MSWFDSASIDPRYFAENLPNIILAIGALGTAAFGIVDGLKLFPWFDLAGFEYLFSGWTSSGGRKGLRYGGSGLEPLLPSLKVAYGANVMDLMKGQYRSGRSGGTLPRTLRQGVRMGLDVMPPQEVEKVAMGLGLPRDVAQAAANGILQKVPIGQLSTDSLRHEQPRDERSAMLRLLTLIDARIEAALALAEMSYATQAKVAAMFVASSIAALVGTFTDVNPAGIVVVGLCAVPVAPVAKDLSSAVQQAVKAFRNR